MALDAEHRVALVRQWRLPANDALLEIPAGGLDVAADGAKEDPELAARRELEEETGLRAGTWRKLGAFYSAPGFTDELMHLFLATDLSPAADDGRLGPDADERLILEWLPWREAVAAAERGDIRDAKSIVGLFWLARLHGDATSGVAAASGAHAATAVPAAADATGDSVTVRYTMTNGEALRAVAGLARRSWAMRVFGIVLILISIIPLLAGDVVSILAILFGVGLLTGWIMVPFAWWQFRKRPDLLDAPTTLVADRDGIAFTTRIATSRIAWSTYRKVHDVGGCLLLDNDAGASVIIPKHAFSASELGVFYRLLDRNGLLPATLKG